MPAYVYDALRDTYSVWLDVVSPVAWEKGMKAIIRGLVHVGVFRLPGLNSQGLQALVADNR